MLGLDFSARAIDEPTPKKMAEKRKPRLNLIDENFSVFFFIGKGGMGTRYGAVGP
jgi:hypothetical protein